jgi:small GTP-binding protein
MELLVEGGAFRCRVVLIGETSVSKTSILNRLIQRRFDSSESSTIGANYQIYVADINSVKLELQIWDTAGQEKFRSLGPIYYRNAIGAIAVFDVTKIDSFHNLEDRIASFVDCVGNDAIISVVGNKTDLENLRKVDPVIARTFAAERQCNYFETSARTGDGIDELFQAFAQSVLQQGKLNNNSNTAEFDLKEKSCQC